MKIQEERIIDAINLFFEECEVLERYSDVTLVGYKNTLARFLKFCDKYEIKHTSDITRGMVIKFLGSVSANTKASSKASYLRPIKIFCKFMASSSMSYGNPCADIATPKFQIPETDFLNYQEVQLVFNVINSQTHRTKLRDKLLLNLLFTYCLRVSEALNLVDEEISHIKKTITILRKGGKLQTIPINNETLGLITQWQGARDKYIKKDSAYNILKTKKQAKYLFANLHGRRLSVSQSHRIVGKYLKLAGIKKNSMGHHIFRHSGASIHIQQGTNIKVLQKLLGHTNIVTTSRYIHTDDLSVRQSIEDMPVL